MAKECMTCKKTKVRKACLTENGTIFSMVNHRPNSKFHFNAITTEHKEDLRNLTSQEWADILPVVKDGITKIENYFQRRNKPGPIGYRLSIPVGKLSGENEPPHFYMRVVPKYKKGWGKIWSKRDIGLPATAPEAVKFRETLQPNQDGVVLEKNKTVARMIGDLNFISISTKAKLANDIQAIDQETWNEIGQMLQELMKKSEDQAGCHSFNVRIIIGEEPNKIFKEEVGTPYSYNNTYSNSELVVNLFPLYEANRQLRLWIPDEREKTAEGTFAGTFEQERLAFKLNNPEEYARIWGKQDKNQELNQLKNELAQSQQQLSQTQQNLTKSQQEVVQQKSKISPLWLIPTILVSWCLAALGFWLFRKKQSKPS